MDLLRVTFFLVILATLFTVVEVKAQSGTQAAISPPAATIPVGSTTTVGVNIYGGEDLNAFDLTITYDPAVVSLESYSAGNYMSNLVRFFENKTADSLRVAYVQLDTPGANGDGLLLSLVFKGLVTGSSPITIQSIVLANKSDKKIYPSIQNGAINVGLVASNTPIPAATATRTATLTRTVAATRTTAYIRSPIPPRTNTPARTLTSTRTPVSSQTSIVGSSATAKPPTMPPATKTAVKTNTIPPANTAAVTPAPTGDPAGADGVPPASEIAASATAAYLPTATSGAGYPTLWTTSTAVGGDTTGFTFIDQIACVTSLILFLILLILIVVIVKRILKDKRSQGD